MRTIITLAAIIFLVALAVLWSRSPLDLAKLLTAAAAADAPAPISPFEIMKARGKDLPVDKPTADPF